MNINLNVLRETAAMALDSLTKSLNNEIDIDGRIVIDACDIQRDMDDLRSMVALLCCCYSEHGDENFQEIYDKIESKGGIAQFNEFEH